MLKVCVLVAILAQARAPSSLLVRYTGAMASMETNNTAKMAIFLKQVGATSSIPHADIGDLVDYLAARLLSLGIRDPIDLGFLCSGKAGFLCLFNRHWTPACLRQQSFCCLRHVRCKCQ